jgi:hypothetical protein
MEQNETGVLIQQLFVTQEQSRSMGRRVMHLCKFYKSYEAADVVSLPCLSVYRSINSSFLGSKLTK